MLVRPADLRNLMFIHAMQYRHAVGPNTLLKHVTSVRNSLSVFLIILYRDNANISEGETSSIFRQNKTYIPRNRSYFW